MKRHTRIIRLVLAISLILCLAGSSHSQKSYKELTYGKLNEVKIPQPKQLTLKNGMKVLLLEDHTLPFIKMQALFVAGSAWEPAEKAGLAGICGTVMRSGGSQTRAGDQIDEDLEKIAASVETYIGLLNGSATLSTLKDHIDRVLAIYADILMNPAFPPEKIDLAKVQLKSAISRRNDFPGNIAQREFNQLIYGDSSPYARDEEYATVDAISRDDLIAFHRAWVRPNGMVLGVWGDFKTGEMAAKIRRTFETWKPAGDGRLAPPPVAYVPKFSVDLVTKTDVNQSNIWMGHLGGKKDNPDLPALIMMNQILNGGFNNRLDNRLRTTEGLAYNVSGAYGTNFAYPGLFYIQLQTQSSRTVEAIRSMQREMKLMTTEMVSEDELREARDSWINSYVFDFDNMDEVMGRLITYAYYGYPADFLQQQRKALEKVTREEVLRVASKYLQPDAVQILVVGNPAEFGEPLSDLGPVTEIDIAIPTGVKVETPAATADNTEATRTLLAKMAVSLGGAEKIAAIKNLTATLKLAQVTQMGEVNMDSQVYVVYPDKSCTVLDTPMGKIKLILNGDQGLMISPQGSMPAPSTLKNNMKENLFRDPVILVRNLKQVTAQLVGETPFADKPAFELLISQGGMAYHLFIDKMSMLPLGVRYTTVGQQGPMEVEERFEDYRDVSGLQMPFKTVGYDKGQKVSETTIVEAKLDTEMDMTMFGK